MSGQIRTRMKQEENRLQMQTQRVDIHKCDTHDGLQEFGKILLLS